MIAEGIYKIKYKTNPLRLTFYAVFFSLILFLLLPLSRLMQDFNQEKEIVRTLELVTLPPPPPPAQTNEQEVLQEEIISIDSLETEIEIEPIDITLEPNLEANLKIQIEMGNFAVKQGSSDLLADIQMFNLSELDTTPISVNDPLFRLPAELADSGITEIYAEALVILTEKGEVEFIQFISLSHQKANTAVRRYIGRLRYTAPTKDGEAGRVRFRLPLRLQTGLSSNGRETREQRNRQNNSARQQRS